MRAAAPVDPDCLLAGGGRLAVKAAKTRSRAAPLNSPFIYRLPYDFKAGEGASYRAADLNTLVARRSSFYYEAVVDAFLTIEGRRSLDGNLQQLGESS